MDLRVYSRVIWRFRVVVGIGFVVACALAFLAVARVNFAGSPKITYRQSQTWSADALLFITQSGFPYGYSVPPTTQVKAPGTTSPTLVPKYASVGTFTQLATYYAPFIQSDQFEAMLRTRTRIRGAVQAATLTANGSTSALPYIEITALATQPSAAVSLANAAARVFSAYIVDQQNVNGVPERQRVRAELISHARAPSLAKGRKKTVPVVVFLTVMFAAVGLAFVLENLRPRIRMTVPMESVPDVEVATRRLPA